MELILSSIRGVYNNICNVLSVLGANSEMKNGQLWLRKLLIFSFTASQINVLGEILSKFTLKICGKTSVVGRHSVRYQLAISVGSVQVTMWLGHL